MRALAHVVAAITFCLIVYGIVLALNVEPQLIKAGSRYS
jgi:hypothetical protein